LGEEAVPGKGVTNRAALNSFGAVLQKAKGKGKKLTIPYEKRLKSGGIKKRGKIDWPKEEERPKNREGTHVTTDKIDLGSLKKPPKDNDKTKNKCGDQENEKDRIRP